VSPQLEVVDPLLRPQPLGHFTWFKTERDQEDCTFRLFFSNIEGVFDFSLNEAPLVHRCSRETYENNMCAAHCFSDLELPVRPTRKLFLVKPWIYAVSPEATVQTTNTVFVS
jgi:hypothetical protein